MPPENDEIKIVPTLVFRKPFAIIVNESGNILNESRPRVRSRVGGQPRSGPVASAAELHCCHWDGTASAAPLGVLAAAVTRDSSVIDDENAATQRADGFRMSEVIIGQDTKWSDLADLLLTVAWWRVCLALLVTVTKERDYADRPDQGD